MEQLLHLGELRAMARALSARAFREQLGPLTLVRRPTKTMTAAAATLRAEAGVGPTSIVQPGVIMARMVLLAMETEDLDVVTLPPLRSTDELQVGRQLDCDLVIDDDSVSKRHAVLRWDEATQVCKLQDFGSTNGTRVNVVIPIKGEVILNDRDIVSFGDVAFLFLLSETLHARLSQPARSLTPMPHR